MKSFSVAGGGIAGLMTAWHLHQRGALDKIYVSDENKAASLVAAGLINPVTGIRFVKSWMADELFPYAFDCYSHMEQKLGTKFFKALNVFRIAESVYQLNDWS